MREVGQGPRGLFPVGHRPHVLGGALASTTASCCATPSNGPPTSRAPVTVTGPGMLDVTVWRQKDSMTVHLVNLTNPMMMKGPLRELIPAPAQKVTVRLPAGARVRKVQLLSGAQTPRIESAAGSITPDRALDSGPGSDRDRPVVAQASGMLRRNELAPGRSERYCSLPA